MRWQSSIVLSILVSALYAYAYTSPNIPVALNFLEAAARNGYKSEKYIVVTEDEYLLTLFRLRRNYTTRGTPTLLMHGLLQSSDSWIDSGPDAGLAYLIAGAGHDLWVGNVRGNYNSRAHTHLKPEDPAFWDFCVDEIGRYDIPAIVDYVLQQTGAAKLNYIGFSQGAGVFYIMCSERPGYCEKANGIIALSPSTRHLYTKSPIFRLVTEGPRELEAILHRGGVHEIFTKGDLSQKLLESFCTVPALVMYCYGLKELLDSVHLMRGRSLTEETLRKVVTHFPSGTSVKNMARYGQAINSKNFVKFDYGRTKNLQIYGSVRPPEYNLSAVTVPVVAIFGKNDGIVDSKDVEWSLEKLPVVLERYIIKDPFWGHLDMTYSIHTKEMVFPKINEYLLKFN